MGLFYTICRIFESISYTRVYISTCQLRNWSESNLNCIPIVFIKAKYWFVFQTNKSESGETNISFRIPYHTKKAIRQRSKIKKLTKTLSKFKRCRRYNSEAEIPTEPRLYSTKDQSAIPWNPSVRTVLRFMFFVTLIARVRSQNFVSAVCVFGGQATMNRITWGTELRGS